MKLLQSGHDGGALPKFLKIEDYRGRVYMWNRNGYVSQLYKNFWQPVSKKKSGRIVAGIQKYLAVENSEKLILDKNPVSREKHPMSETKTDFEFLYETMGQLEAEKRNRDKNNIPLKDAMICWNPIYATMFGPPGAIRVVVWPDVGQVAEGLSMSVGACFSNWRNLSDDARLTQLLCDMWTILCRDGVEVEAMHEALSVIPEYRDILTGEGLFSWRK